LMAQATAAARRAIELAPRLASGHQALGLVIKTQLHMGGALAEYQRAYALAGDDAQTVRNYAVTVALLGHSREALALVARAVALDPLHISSRASLSRILFLARRYAEAEAAARGVLAAAPKRSTTRLFLADS